MRAPIIRGAYCASNTHPSTPLAGGTEKENGHHIHIRPNKNRWSETMGAGSVGNGVFAGVAICFETACDEEGVENWQPRIFQMHW
jgi:hypothetical protein